jgi:metal-dependent HD superfamily phosphatase/phosphodiesterase
VAEVTFQMIRDDEETRCYITKAHEMLAAIGFTEHGLRHVGLVAHRAMRLLEKLGAEQRLIEMVGIAGLLHDVGNVVNRRDHGQTSALMARAILTRLQMPFEEIAEVMAAIGNHEEEVGNAVNDIAAALILADKSDVHRSRVYNRDFAQFDIHDRVNYACTHSDLVTDSEAKTVGLNLTIDTDIIALMEYFEIFLVRMVMCRRAAEQLGCRFELCMNGVKLL